MSENSQRVNASTSDRFAGNSNVTVVTCIIALMSFLMFLGQAMMKCFRDFGPIKYAVSFHTSTKQLHFNDSCTPATEHEVR